MRLPGAGGGRAATSQSLFRGFLLLPAVGSLPCALGGGASAPVPGAQCPRPKVGSWVIKSRPRREATQWHRTHGAELRCPPSRGCRVPRGVGPHRATPSRTGFLTPGTVRDPKWRPSQPQPRRCGHGAVPRGARTPAHAWAHAGTGHTWMHTYSVFPSVARAAWPAQPHPRQKRGWRGVRDGGSVCFCAWCLAGGAGQSWSPPALSPVPPASMGNAFPWTSPAALGPGPLPLPQPPPWAGVRE